MVELLDDWNVDVTSWKYPRKLESTRVSSPGFVNNSKMMVIKTPKKISGKIPYRFVTDGAQHQTCLIRSLQLPVRQFQGRPRLGHIGLYARRPVRCVPLTTTHFHLRLTWSKEHALWTPQQWSCVMFFDQSRFSLQSDSRQTLIWKSARYPLPPREHH
ncbi:transposable element Tcb1 transposase [Trichonephila clavipes]|nr:transposable element Tcb1 transposase [Trichonephila clavipes]